MDPNEIAGLIVIAAVCIVAGLLVIAASRLFGWGPVALAGIAFAAGYAARGWIGP